MRGKIGTGRALWAKLAPEPREQNHRSGRAAIYRCGRPESATPTGCGLCRL